MLKADTKIGAHPLGYSAIMAVGISVKRPENISRLMVSKWCPQVSHVLKATEAIKGHSTK